MRLERSIGRRMVFASVVVILTMLLQASVVRALDDIYLPFLIRSEPPETKPRQIAFVSDRGGWNTVHSMNVDGSDVARRHKDRL